MNDVTGNADLVPNGGEPDSRKTTGDALSEAMRPQQEEQEVESQDVAVAFLSKLLRLRGAHIDREQFLRSELEREGVPEEMINAAVTGRPASAGVPGDILEQIARRAITLETRKSSTFAFAMGLPGGLTMIGSVPADMTQYYVHAFRVMQKLSFLYGWQDFIQDCDHVDDETLARLGVVFGVMLGVSGASSTLSAFANNVARPKLQKDLAQKALTQTAYYPVIKKTLGRVGVHINKQIFSRTVTKAVPVVGGVASGALTYATLRRQSNRLLDHLKILPPALPDPQDASGIAARDGA